LRLWIATYTNRNSSWRRAYEALCDCTGDPFTPVPEFFEDKAAVAILNRPFEPFQSPSAQAKAEFETLTAAIHVTPSGNGSYKVQEIKDDTVWLSKEAKCDEVAALRITILEWQSRPAVRLLENDTEEPQDNTATPTLGENGTVGTSDRNPSIFERGSEVDKRPTFDNTEQRRKRLLRLFLSEHAFVLRCAELLVRNWILAPAIDKEDIAVAACVGSLGATLRSALRSGGDWEQVVKASVNALQKRVDKLDSSSGWTFDDDTSTTVEDLWVESQFHEMIIISQILLLETADADAVPSSATASTFFDFYARYAFFRDISSIFPSKVLLTSTLQAMTCVASVSFLLGGDLRDCIDPELQDYATTRSGTTSAGFINDPFCVEKIHTIMMDLASSGPSPAVPSIFIWSFALMIIRDCFHPSRIPYGQARYSIGARSSSPAPNQADITNVYEQAWNLISTTALSTQHEHVAAYLASITVDELHLFEFITQVVRTLQPFYDNAVDRTIDYQARSMLLQLLRGSGRLVRYGSEVVGALLSVIGSGRPYWTSLHNALESDYDPVAQEFLSDTGLVIAFVDEARARFPFETTPFLTLMTTVLLNASQDSDTVEKNLALLQEVDRFTQKLPPRFIAIDQEDVDLTADTEEDRVRLSVDLPMFVDRRGPRPGTQRALATSQVAPMHASPKAEGLVLRAGIPGIIADSLSRELIVSWLHKYNPLQYLAASLASLLPGSEQIPYGAGPEISTEDVSSIIGLFAALLISLSHSDSGERSSLRDAANSILDDSLLDVLPGQDLTSVIYEIFEAQLQQSLQSPNAEDSLDLLIRCVQFFHAVTLITPSRIWPLFARSRLLDVDGDGGSLVTIVTSIEMVAGRYDLLFSCIRLYEALIDASFNDVVVRPQASKVLTRFGFQARNDLLIQAAPTKTKAAVIMDFLRTFVSVFESYQNWRYQSLDDRTDIGTWIAKIFTKILTYAYAIGDTTSATGDLTAFLQGAADYLVNRILSTSKTAIAAPLFEMISGGLRIANPLARKVTEERVIDQTVTALKLCTTSVRLGIFLDRKRSILQEDILQNASLLAKVYAADPGYRVHVANMFEALIRAYGQESVQPPSLLGYVGPRASKDFLTLIHRLGRPECNKEAERDLWNLLSAVVSSRQQWFAIFVLTGVPPRERPKDGKTIEKSKVVGWSLLSYALDQLSGLELEQFRSKRTVEILHFVALSLNHWPWVMGELRKHPTFIKDICKFVTKLKMDDRNDSQRGRVAYYSEAAAAAAVAEILAMYLHSARQLGDTKAAEQILPHLPFLWNYGIVDPPYTQSLHSNLSKNLEKHCPGLRLSGLKHTALLLRVYGDDYFYDIKVAAQVLKASDRGRSSVSNFVADIVDANEELSVIDSQIELFKRWTFLVVEISNIGSPDTETVDHLIKLTRRCLELAGPSGSRELPEPVCEQLRKMRLDLACLLLQKALSLPTSTTGLMDLFAVAWNTIRSLVPDFDTAYTGKASDQYRLLLQILFLTTQPLAKVKLSKESNSNTLRLSVLGAPRQESQSERASYQEQSTDLLEVLDLVIAKGFQTLAASLHENAAAASPSDFVLLTALLQTILSIPRIGLVQAEVSAKFTANNTIRYALSLFSWAEQLSAGGDPIYGEVSLLFLLALSTVAPLAESLAVEGALASIRCAPLTRHLARAAGTGPFDAPPRLHRIWARGLLPLCLNMLDAVGPPVAAEVVAFLNLFPAQLRRVAAALANRAAPVGGLRAGDKSAMTLGVAAEAHALALIWRIVERCRKGGAGAGAIEGDIPALAWDGQTAKEDCEDWVNGRATLADRVVPSDEREAELARLKPVDGTGSGVANRLEERVFAELRGAVECLSEEV